MNSQELKEKIAKNAASTWCRCFKCDGIVNDTKTICDKDKLFTCHQWYNGYRTAVLALGDDRLAEYLEYWDEEEESQIRELEGLVKDRWRKAELDNDQFWIHEMSNLSFFLKTLKKKRQKLLSEEQLKEGLEDAARKWGRKCII